MRDSLLSRFRGALLGVLLGEAIGTHTSPQPSRWVWQQIIQGQFNGSLKATRLDSAAKPILAQVSALICPDQYPTQATEPLSHHPIAAGVEPDVPGTEALLLTLPLALLYHDQPVLYRTVLGTAINQQATEVMMAATVVGHTISLILRERFVRSELIPQLLQDLDLYKLHPALTDQLIQVQSWIEEPTDLASVIRSVKHGSNIPASATPETMAVTLALYSFLCTPDDFRLSLLRSAQLPSVLTSTLLTSMLTGAISGVYNGLLGLPIAWRQQIWLGEVDELIQRWGVASEVEVEQLADCLLACWSGAIDPIQWLQQPQFNRITAAPRAIRFD